MLLNYHNSTTGEFIRQIPTPGFVRVSNRRISLPAVPDDMAYLNLLGLYAVSEPATPEYNPLCENLQYGQYQVENGVSTRTVSVVPIDLSTAKNNYYNAITSAYDEAKNTPVMTTSGVPLGITEANQIDWLKGKAKSDRKPSDLIPVRGTDRITRQTDSATFLALFDELQVAVQTLMQKKWDLDDLVTAAVSVSELKTITGFDNEIITA